MTARPRYPRSSCFSPGCRRWSTLFQGEWLCGDHWREVPLRLRRRHRALVRAFRRRRAASDWRGARKAARLFERNWEVIKRSAVERAAGIG